MIKRLVTISLIVLTIMAVAVGLAGWLFFSSWLPTKGKARLIETLEQNAPITCHIQTLRYHLLRGFVLDRVEIVDRASHEVWLSTQQMDLELGWLPLIVQRTILFRVRALLDAPCPTDVTFAGRYHLADRSLILEVRTGEIAVKSIKKPVKRYLPPQLTEGSVRLMLHLTHQNDRTAVTIEDLTATQCVWSEPPLTIRADASLHGHISPPQQVEAPWENELSITIRRGEASGIPTVRTINRLEGTAELSQHQLTITRLTGTALETMWTLEGVIGPLNSPSIQALLTSRVELSKLTPLFPALNQDWPVEGPVDLTASCHGPLTPPVQLDCLVHGDLRGTTLSSPLITTPLTQITGSVDYDMLTRHVSINRIEGRLAGERLSATGKIALQPTMTLALDINGTLPLEPLSVRLGVMTPLRQIHGTAALQLHLDGPAAAPTPTGRIDLHDAGFHLIDSPHTIDQLHGTILLNELQFNVEDASMQFDGCPLTLTAAIIPGRVPRTMARIGFPQGHVQFAGHLTPTQMAIDSGELALPHTRLQFNGTVSRTPEQSIHLTTNGVVELGELQTLPCWPTTQLAGWDPQGPVEIVGELSGPLQDWRAMTISGRVKADRLRVHHIPLAQLTGTVEQRNHVVRVNIPAALIGDGKFWGELTIDQRPRLTNYLLQADIVGLQLAGLTEVIPAWRSRSASGTASAHAVMSGAWEDHSSWRAEGWCNAAGERLADIPLLDQLFRGLFGVLGDRLGLEMLRRAEITQVSGRWRLTEERFNTDDLRLGGLAGNEPVAIYATGSIGLDRTLDFIVEPELSEGALLQSQVTSTLAGTILKAAGKLDRLRRLVGRHRLTGTIDKPNYRFELTLQELLKQLVPGPTDLLQQLFDTVHSQ